MTDELIAILTVGVGCCVAIPMYRWLRWRKTKKRKFIERAERKGYCVVGEYESSKFYPGITDGETPRLRDDSLDVKYRYVVNGVTYYKKLYFQSRGHIGTDYPSTVKVYYDPRNPKKAVCPEEAHPSQQIQSGCLITAVVTVLLMFAFFHTVKFLFG